MKKHYFKIVRTLLFVACISVSLVGCEEGENGLTGLDGIVGTDGENGIDGENAIGYNELSQYGAISLKITGTRHDDVAFTHEQELKFIHNEPNKNDFINNDPNYNFSIYRFLNSPDGHEANSAELSFTVNDAGLATQSFSLSVDFDDYSVVSDDFKYFVLENGYSHDDSGVSNFSLTDYSFDTATKRLFFSFSMDIAGADNTTGNDMTISGTVDVTVFEKINGGGPF